MKLIAMKKLYYPRGPGGRDYQAGEEFEASERDAKALTLVRAARAAEPKADAKRRYVRRDVQAED